MTRGSFDRVSGMFGLNFATHASETCPHPLKIVTSLFPVDCWLISTSVPNPLLKVERAIMSPSVFWIVYSVTAELPGANASEIVAIGRWSQSSTKTFVTVVIASCFDIATSFPSGPVHVCWLVKLKGSLRMVPRLITLPLSATSVLSDAETTS